MKKFSLTFFCLFSFLHLFAKEALDPSISPALFQYYDQITVTYDVTGTTLASLSSAYIWVWIPGENIDANYNINPANNDPSKSDYAKFTKSEVDGSTFFSISFNPSTFFTQDISQVTQIGMLLKGNDWSDGQTTDFIANFWDGSFQLKLTSPVQKPLFVQNGEEIIIEAETPVLASFDLYLNETLIHEVNDSYDFSYKHTVTETEGSSKFRLVASSEGNSDEISFQYLISVESPPQTRPINIIPGINYDPADDTKVTLCLLAPGKSSVYVLGDFSNWDVLPENIMYQDGNYFWIELKELTEGSEYAFQYLVDEKLFIADPFAEKILDPGDDKYIPSSIYPDLKQVSENAVKDNWWNNRFSILQTAQPLFNWEHNNYGKPSNEELVIYELLIRDFFDENDRNYLHIIDTLSYLKSLGVNAIELMPIQEFAGNNSWGYNPTFMFAPDKAYGAEEALKKFIDAAHAKDIAVILDVVFNHQELPNPYVAMWFDFENFKVTSDNPMFNVEATHPYSVFYDMNHESELTQYYVDTTLNYWIDQYHIDGFRFDLSKGFTQTVNTDVGLWGHKDENRIAILKRIADKVWEKNPDTYIILEHFADNDEEKELEAYGMMLWGNAHWDYKDLAIGTAKDISWSYYGTRDWQHPNLVSYMESHDEERIMYDLLNNGKSQGSYNIQNPETAYDRIKAASAFFYSTPGPKMLWEFGELGYDYSINLCEDGTTIDNGCRTSPKPVGWNYYGDNSRQKIKEVTKSLIKLRSDYDVFETGEFLMTNSTSLIKEISLIDKNHTALPANANEMSVYVIGNFDTQSKTITTNFPFTGNWYHFFSGGQMLNVEDINMNLTLTAGEFRIYTNYPVDFPPLELMSFVIPKKITDLLGTPSGNGVTLTWENDSEISGEIRIYRAQQGDDISLLTTLSVGQKSFLDTDNLIIGETYEYKVANANKYGENPSETISVVAPQITVIEQDKVDRLAIFPNPAHDKINVKLPDNFGQVSKIKIYNTLGQQRINIDKPLIKDNSQVIDLINLSPGIYIIKIEGENMTYSKSFIKE